MSSELFSHEESFILAEAQWAVRGDDEEGYQLHFSINDTSFGFIRQSSDEYYWIAYVVSADSVYAGVDPDGWIHGTGPSIEEAKEALYKAVITNYIQLEVE